MLNWVCIEPPAMLYEPSLTNASEDVPSQRCRVFCSAFFVFPGDRCLAAVHKNIGGLVIEAFRNCKRDVSHGPMRSGAYTHIDILYHDCMTYCIHI